MIRPFIGFARSSLEVRFWMELQRCPECGEREIGDGHLRDWGAHIQPDGQRHTGGIYEVTCPRCGHHREVDFFEQAGFRTHHAPSELGGANPSTIITPVEFSTELQRGIVLVPLEFEHLSDPELDFIAAARGSAYTSALELLKFIPAGANEIPDDAFGADLSYKHEHAAELTRAYLERQAEYLADYLVRMREASDRRDAANPPSEKRRLPIPAFSLASLKLHEQWVREGDKGDNQPLIAQGADATEMKLSARNLSGATMDKVTLDRADLSYAALDNARLVDVSFRGASLANGSAYEAKFFGCHFEGADAFLFKLRATQLDRCDFTGTNLMRSVWTQCTVTNTLFVGADLRNARLDEALFVDCDLRGADLSVPEPGVNTMRGARFTRCDLRGVKWDGRDLDGAVFAGCARD